MTGLSRPNEDAVRILAVGDVLIDRDDPLVAFEPSSRLFRDAHLRFGNCEAVYVDGVQRAPSASIPVLGKRAHGAQLGRAGFDVMSLANNHTVDGGHEGLLGTMALLDEQGVSVCGAGPDAATAYAPAVLEAGGLRIAFLAYSCEFPPGYAVGEDTPGIAVIRTHDIYVPSAMSAFQSGGAPERLTVIDPRDLRQVTADIAAAHSAADIVIVSVHIGDGSQPAVILDHERTLAHSLIDAGADAYLGHHHHMLRGAEYHRGRPIFYGLGHFVFDVPDFESQVPPSILARMYEHAGEYGYGYRDGYPLLPMHPEARMTMVAILELSADGTIRAGAVPCELNPDGQPVPLDARTTGRHVLDYLRMLNASQELGAEWSISDRMAGGLPIVDLKARS